MSSLPKTHHVRQELCTTRPAYRSGRQLKAVKAWNIYMPGVTKYCSAAAPAAGSVLQRIQNSPPPTRY